MREVALRSTAREPRCHRRLAARSKASQSLYLALGSAHRVLADCRQGPTHPPCIGAGQIAACGQRRRRRACAADRPAAPRLLSARARSAGPRGTAIGPNVSVSDRGPVISAIASLRPSCYDHNAAVPARHRARPDQVFYKLARPSLLFGLGRVRIRRRDRLLHSVVQVRRVNNGGRFEIHRPGDHANLNSY